MLTQPEIGELKTQESFDLGLQGKSQDFQRETTGDRKSYCLSALTSFFSSSLNFPPAHLEFRQSCTKCPDRLELYLKNSVECREESNRGTRSGVK